MQIELTQSEAADILAALANDIAASQSHGEIMKLSALDRKIYAAMKADEKEEQP